MNNNQFQLEVCKSILKNNPKCRYAILNERQVAVTTDGFSAVVFYIEECVFDIGKMIKSPVIGKFFDNIENDIPIKKSRQMFSVGDKIMEKYEGENLEIYAFSNVSKRFGKYSLFANLEKTRIIAKDQFGRVVGLFMPANPIGLQED